MVVWKVKGARQKSGDKTIGKEILKLIQIVMLNFLDLKIDVTTIH